MRRRTMRRGVTLLELLVTLALLAILTSVVGLSFRHAGPGRVVDGRLAQVAAARDLALRSGHAVTITIADSAGISSATAYPDGRVLADPSVGVDLLTGSHAR